MRAIVLATDESGKSFLACWRINEPRGHRRHRGEAKDAERTALLIFIRLRRMLTAILRLRFLLHLGATAGLDLLGRYPCGRLRPRSKRAVAPRWRRTRPRTTAVSMRRSRMKISSVARCAHFAWRSCLRRRLSSILLRAKNRCLRCPRASTPARTVLLFHRRAARPFNRAGSSRDCGARVRELQQEDFYEIPIDAHGGYRAHRHSLRDFAFG